MCKWSKFAKKMTREKRIPFDVSVDPLYSESNMAYLKKVVEDIEWQVQDKKTLKRINML